MSFFTCPGAFIPAVPVQPVVIRYPNKLVRLFKEILDLFLPLFIIFNVVK